MRIDYESHCTPGALRIIPFAVFMVFIGIEELLVFLDSRGFLEITAVSLQWLYLPRILFTASALLVLCTAYSEVRIRDLLNLWHTSASLLTGIVIFLFWINLDWTLPIQGGPRGFDPLLFADDYSRNLMIATRAAGAVLLVPVIEELFWRSWLLRYLVRSDFTTVAIGSFTPFSFLASSVLFGLEHHFIIAGIVAGVLFNLLCYYTRSIVQCILAHAFANLLLAGYVLITASWRFW